MSGNAAISPIILLISLRIQRYNYIGRNQVKLTILDKNNILRENSFAL